MFYYFGRKARTAATYPAPAYPLVIEPFAGSMAYSLHYRPAQAIGIERDPHVSALWHRLVALTEDELLDIPAPVVGERTTDRWVLSAAQSNATNLVNYRTVNAFMVKRFEEQRRMAVRHLSYARTVLYAHGDYRQAPDIEATWFIDPPYQGVTNGYRHTKDIDYDELAEWCMSRRGQRIICEGSSGNWLPFQHHRTGQGVPTWGERVSVERTLVTQTHRRCAQCNITFPASRSDARYCSARCRKRASRVK